MNVRNGLPAGACPAARPGTARKQVQYKTPADSLSSTFISKLHDRRFTFMPIEAS